MYAGGHHLIVLMARELLKQYQVTVPVALHLDHGSSFESCEMAMKTGFTSVMIDGSYLSLGENMEVTRSVVQAATRYGVSVEAELGRISGQEEGRIVNESEATVASPIECHKFVVKTGIDCLAPALGTVHGPYQGEPALRCDLIEELRKTIRVPIALHGGTGISVLDLKKAISLGVAKININSENQTVFTSMVRKVLAEDPHLYDPRKYAGRAIDAMKDSVKRSMQVFGSAGKHKETVS